MGINSEPLDKFYPRCAICGEPIDGDGYDVDGVYYHDECMEMNRVDGTAVAETLRESAFEEAQEHFYAE